MYWRHYLNTKPIQTEARALTDKELAMLKKYNVQLIYVPWATPPG